MSIPLLFVHALMGNVIRVSPSMCGALFPDAEHERVVRALGLGVIAIAVERDASANARDDLSNPNLFHLLFQLFQQRRRAARLGTASVENDVPVDSAQVVCLCHSQQCQRIVNRTVRTFLREQTDQVQIRIPLLDFIDRAKKSLVGVERTVLHREIESHVVLQDHASRADVHVPGFGITGFARVQTNRVAGGLQLRIWIPLGQIVPDGRLREKDRVCIVTLADAPPIENDEHYAPLAAPVVHAR